MEGIILMATRKFQTRRTYDFFDIAARIVVMSSSRVILQIDKYFAMRYGHEHFDLEIVRF